MEGRGYFSGLSKQKKGQLPTTTRISSVRSRGQRQSNKGGINRHHGKRLQVPMLARALDQIRVKRLNPVRVQSAAGTRASQIPENAGGSAALRSRCRLETDDEGVDQNERRAGLLDVGAVSHLDTNEPSKS